AEGRVSTKHDERRHGGYKRRRPPVGAAPGALVFPVGTTRLNVIRYDKTELVERKDVRLDELPSLIVPGHVTWIEVEGLGDQAAMRRIAELVHLHPLALADIVNAGQRPKAEAYGDFELVVCRAPCPRSPLEFELEQVSLVLASEVVVSFHEGERDVFEPVR